MKIYKFFWLLVFTAYTGCDPKTDMEELAATQDIEIEVDYFEHATNLDTMKERLSYRITYTNPNSFTILGAPSKTTKTTTVAGGDIIAKEIPFVGKTPCQELGPGENCIDEFFSETELNLDLNDPNDLPVITLVKVEYTIREELR